MKYHHLLPLAALASSAAIHDRADGQFVLQGESVAGDSFWDNFPSRKEIASSIENLAGSIGHGIDQAIESASRAGRHLADSILDNDGDSRRDTLYDLIRRSHQARRFAKMIDKHDDIRRKLQSEEAEYTVFVPTDEAFDNMPKDDENAGKEFMEKILEYHIIRGTFSTARIMSEHTIPTMLEERDLGFQKQRVRVGVGLFGIQLNFYSRIVASNIVACNGIIHVVNGVLVPPPRQGKLIDAVPGRFSTFSLAMEKTGLGHHLHNRPQRGGTVFAPNNDAWEALGPKLNAFLFSHEGLDYLRALLKYHISINETLYTDAFYERDDGDRDRDDDDRTCDSRRRRDRDDNRRRRHGRDRDDRRDDRDDRRDRRDHRRRRNGQSPDDGDLETAYTGRRHRGGRRCPGGDDNDVHTAGARSLPNDDQWHVELPTLLGDRYLNVDSYRWLARTMTAVRVNARSISVEDAVARDGVVHVVDSVLVPLPERQHNADDDRNDNYEHDGISVDQLKSRLREFVEDGDDDEDYAWDL